MNRIHIHYRQTNIKKITTIARIRLVLINELVAIHLKLIKRQYRKNKLSTILFIMTLDTIVYKA